LALTVVASGSSTLQYQWFRNGTAIPGATVANFQVASAQSSDGGAYYVTISDTAGNTTSTTASVTVLTPPTITAQPLSQTVNAGVATILSVQAGSASPLQYQWFHNGSAVTGGTSTSLQISAAQLSDTGTYYVRVSNGLSVTSATATITVLAAPTITVQPAAQTITAGTQLMLGVQANGTALLQYQWFKDGTAVAGATSSILQISSARSSDTATYYVRISNSIGTVTSANAAIVVLVPPAITLQPANQTVATGSSLTLSVQATGTGTLQYQWFHNGTAVAGAMFSSLQLASVQNADEGPYYVQIWNGAGIVTSATATLTVNAFAPSITVQPASQAVNVNTGVSLTVQASGPGLQYQWYRNGVAITGATSAAFSIASAKSADAATYYVTVSNSAGTATSAAVSITVNAPPTITTQPLSQAITVGGSFTLSIQAAGGSPLQYQWFHDAIAIPGATSSTYQIVSAQSLDAGNYSVRVSNASGAVTSTTITVTVNLIALPSIISQPVGQTVGVANPFSLSVQANGSAPLQYQWFQNGVAIVGATSPGFQIAAAQNSDSGDYFVRVSNTAGKANSATATVTVMAPPMITLQPQSQSAVLDATVALSVQANGLAPLQYQWFHNDAVIPGETSATLQITSAQAPDGGDYYVTVSNSAGTVTSATATVTLNPAVVPTIISQSADEAVAVGSFLDLWVQASGSAPLQYQWFHDGAAVPGATSSALQVASVQSRDSGIYYVTVSNSAGAASSATMTVTVTVQLSPTIISQPSGQTISPGDSLNLSVQATGAAPLQYQWYHEGDPVAGGTSAALQVASAQASDSGSYYVRVSNQAGTVTSASVTVAVSLSAPPNITTQPTNQDVVAGSALTLSVQVTGSAPFQCQWFRDGVPVAGATSLTLQVASARSSDGGNYTMTVSNAVGTATSTPATVTVLVPPNITSAPVSQSISVGSSLVLSVQASGPGPLQYQWFHDGNAIIDATFSNLQIAAAQTSDSGNYYVKVSNTAGSVTSAGVVISVTGSAIAVSKPVILTQPFGQTIAADTTATLTVQADGGGLHYQWYHNGVPIPEATSGVLQIPSAQFSDSGNYYVTVDNTFGTATSASASLAVLAGPAISDQPANQTAGTGAQVTFSVQATGSGSLVFQWYRNGVAIPNATSSALTINSAQPGDAGVYNVTVQNAAARLTSSNATLNVLMGGVRLVTNNGKSAADGGATSTAYLNLQPGQAAVIPPDSNGVIVIQMIGTPGKVYDIQSCDNLTTLQLVTIATVVAADDGLIEIALLSTGAGQFIQAVAH
jgi:hypothetical protein